MVAELRLILLGLGVALVVGLWWWERRRTGASRAESPPRTEMFEPRLAVEVHPAGAGTSDEAAQAPPTELDTQELPTMRAPVLDRPVPRGNPPVITIDDLPDDPVDVEFTPTPRRVETMHARAPMSARAAADRRRPVPDPPIVAEPVETLEETLDEPLDEPLMSTEPSAQPEAGETPPRHQRIIAVRLLGRDGQRIDGHDLKAALGGEGLEFGRYSIYHRVVDGGRPLYSVASLVEPGSFDPNVMDSARFPGVSMFAVFPGPLPAPQCFDELLATARRLADRLGATLQDDSGSSLTGQRVLSIREDLVHFEHLVALSRSRPRA